MFMGLFFKRIKMIVEFEDLWVTEESFIDSFNRDTHTIYHDLIRESEIITTICINSVVAKFYIRSLKVITIVIDLQLSSNASSLNKINHIIPRDYYVVSIDIDLWITRANILREDIHNFSDRTISREVF